MNRSPCPPTPRSASASYDIPSPGGGVLKAFLGNWSTDSIIYARSASPANVVTGLDPFTTGFLAGAFGRARPNLVPGVPLYLDESGAPGGESSTWQPSAYALRGKETWDTMHGGDSAPLSSI